MMREPCETAITHCLALTAIAVVEPAPFTHLPLRAAQAWVASRWGEDLERICYDLVRSLRCLSLWGDYVQERKRVSSVTGHPIWDKGNDSEGSGGVSCVQEGTC